MTGSYTRFMDEIVTPWIREHVIHEGLESADGLFLNTYRAVHPEAKANLVIIHGFCEFFGKYEEMMWRFYREGYSVFFTELRGHGYSGRVVQTEDERVYVRDFTEYVEDVNAFVQKSVLSCAAGKPLFLFGHSMGGCIGTLYLERYPEVFSCAVLNAPMLKVNFGRIPDAAVSGISAIAEVMAKELEYTPGGSAFDGIPDYEHSSMQSYARYMRMFEMRRKDRHYQTWGATIGWAHAAKAATEEAVRNAGRIAVPVLICQAGLDHLVRPEGQEEAAAKNDKITLVRYPKSKHEIYNSTDEIREGWYRDVLAFYRAWTF